MHRLGSQSMCRLCFGSNVLFLLFQWPFALILGLAGLALSLALAFPGLAVGLPLIGLTRCFLAVGREVGCSDGEACEMCELPDALFIAAVWPMGLLCCPCITVLSFVFDYDD